ncbi:MAG: gliding motility-associated C-terminal domain-containing protein, partial [Bacteroidota bacterium]|nr:gliding motility-associated C-terminal domain-containing protein [Bacteroidota bacterium]
ATGGTWSGTGITNPTTGTFDPSAANTGANTITYQVTQNGCSGVKNITINVFETPNTTITSVDVICYDTTFIQLEASTLGGFWTGNGVSPSGVFDVAQAGIGMHHIVYTINDVCFSSSSIDIFVIKGVSDYEYTVNSPYCMGGDDGKITIAATGGTAPYTYIIGNDTIADIYKQALFSGLSNGIYNITITDNNGCFLITDDIFLDEGNKDCIKIPDAFTPNGDGLNDEWIIENLWAFDKHVVKVFNRWGQQVYEGTHGSQPWDGTLKGKPLPTGSYMYILELNNTEIKKEFVGIVTLIR